MHPVDYCLLLLELTPSHVVNVQGAGRSGRILRTVEIAVRLRKTAVETSGTSSSRLLSSLSSPSPRPIRLRPCTGLTESVHLSGGASLRAPIVQTAVLFSCSRSLQHISLALVLHTSLSARPLIRVGMWNGLSLEPLSPSSVH